MSENDERGKDQGGPQEPPTWQPPADQPAPPPYGQQPYVEPGYGQDQPPSYGQTPPPAYGEQPPAYGAPPPPPPYQGGYPQPGGYQQGGYQQGGYQQPGGFPPPAYGAATPAWSAPRSAEASSLRTQAIVSLVLNILAVLSCCNVIAIAGAICAGLAIGRVDTDVTRARSLVRWSWGLLAAGLVLVVLGFVGLLALGVLSDTTGGNDF